MGNLRDTIFSANDKKLTRVHVPEWDVDVFIGAMSGANRELVEVVFDESGGNPLKKWVNFRAKIVQMGLYDESGELVFTVEDVESLGTKNANVIDRLFDLVFAASELTDESVGELVGNSNGGQAAVSGIA